MTGGCGWYHFLNYAALKLFFVGFCFLPKEMVLKMIGEKVHLSDVYSKAQRRIVKNATTEKSNSRLGQV